MKEITVERKGWQQSTDRMVVETHNPFSDPAPVVIELEQGGEVVSQRRPTANPGTERHIMSGVPNPQGSLTVREVKTVRGPRKDKGEEKKPNPDNRQSPGNGPPEPDTGDDETTEKAKDGILEIAPEVAVGVVVSVVVAIILGITGMGQS